MSGQEYADWVAKAATRHKELMTQAGFIAGAPAAGASTEAAPAAAAPAAGAAPETKTN
jgi:hypothetical protein